MCIPVLWYQDKVHLLKVRYQDHIFKEKFNVGHNFGMASDRAYIFHMLIQGHIKKKKKK